MTHEDLLTITQWYVEEGDIVNPQDFLLEVDAPPGFISIPVPPTVTTAARVERIEAEKKIRLGDLLLTLEPLFAS